MPLWNWLKPSNEPSCINYSSFWTHRAGPQPGGGIAKWYTSFSKTLNVFNRNSKLKIHAIKIIVNPNLTLDLVNSYNPSENITCSKSDFYFKQLNTNMIIVGDFNCHHRMWDTRSPSNVAGPNLVEALILHPSITLLTPTSLPTHYNIASGTFSTLDLAFIYSHLYPISQVTVGKILVVITIQQ